MEEYAHLAGTPPATDPGSATRAILAGVAAAVAGGVAWALIVMVTHYELGIVAWGLGALVGLAMAATTAERSMGWGLTAAGIALGGLLLGKVLIALFVMGSSAVEGIAEEPELLQQAVVYDMELNGFPSDVQARYDAVPDGATFPDDLWGDMLAAAEERLVSMDEEARTAVADQWARAVLGDMTVVERVMSQFGGFDLLWVFFALGTAWKMLAAHDEEELAAAE